MKSYASLQRIFTISGADMCVKQNMGEIANHFLRQKYHFEVPCGWCNDPNGFIYWNGSYHLFYQHTEMLRRHQTLYKRESHKTHPQTARSRRSSLHKKSRRLLFMLLLEGCHCGHT